MRTLSLLLVLSACSRPEPEERDRPEAYPWITDEQGRVLILHGVNVSNSSKSAPDHMPSEDRATLERIAADWGWNHVRFLIFWDGLEPEKGQWDDAYLDRIEARLDDLDDMGLHVVLDMHQDVYSAAFCCDGAPEWAIRDDGLPFELQPQWFLNYFQPAVQRAFDNFWLYDEGDHADLQEHYLASWERVADRFADHPAVIGYDLMNEPHPGSLNDSDELLGIERPNGTNATFDRERLQPFYQRGIDRIRAVDPDSWIFFEPRYGAPGDGMPSYMGLLEDPRADGPRLVYHPHLYSIVLEASGRYDEGDETVAKWEHNRALEAEAQGAPVVLGEWGLAQSTVDGDRFMRDVVEMADRQMAGWTYWDYTFGGWLPVDGSGQELPNLDVLVRPYPRRIAGTPTGFGFDADTRVFTLTFEDRAGVTGPTELHVPARHFPEGWTVTCSDPEGAWSWDFDAATETLRVTTDGESSPHTVEIRPAGGG